MPGSLNHLGIEVATTDEVRAAQARLAEDDLDTTTEDGVACCFAVQDKVWVDGPDDRPWEIYTVLADVAETTTCCDAAPQSAARAAARRAPVDRDLARRASAEAVGTALLVAIVVGSGIAAQRLSPHDVGLRLLENSTATGAGLIALILAIGPVSGAHFNPVVTLADRLLGGTTNRAASVYVIAQVVGGCVGRGHRESDVRAPRGHTVDARPLVGWALARRDRRDLRVARDDPRSGPRGPHALRRVRGRRLHRGRLLVHVVDELRQPRGHGRARCSPTRSRGSSPRAFRCSSWPRSWARSRRSG